MKKMISGLFRALGRALAWILKRLVVLIIIIGILLAGIKHFLPNFNDTLTEKVREISVIDIQATLKPIGELATMEDDYNLIYTDSSYRSFAGVPFKLTTSNYIEADYDGRIKVGFIISEIGIDIDNNNRIIHILLPEPVTLSHEIIGYTLHENSHNNIFNPFDADDLMKGIMETKEEAYKDAQLDKKINEEAVINMQAIVIQYLTIFDDYTVVFD